MKKTLLALAFCLAAAFAANAQKYACVNTEYILSNIPDYDQAQQTLDKFSVDWQKEIEAKFQEIDKLYKSYQSEAYLLPEDLKNKRQDEIIEKEKEVKELQKKRFGSGGDLEKKREDLMKPIQDKVYSAIEKYATAKGYSIIFDKSSDSSIIYANAKADVSDDILKQMGYTAKQ